MSVVESKHRSTIGDSTDATRAVRWSTNRLGDVLLETLSEMRPSSLDTLDAGSSAGAYLLFYYGNLHLLSQISGGESALYVGSTSRLSRRLREHRTSLEQAENLQVDDFRAAVLQAKTHADALLAEALLIERLCPPWNAVGVEGFGSKPQGHLRAGGQTPTPWDHLHPGRPWVTASVDTPATEAARNALEQAMSQVRPIHGWSVADSDCGEVGDGHGEDRRRERRAPRRGRTTVMRDASPKTTRAVEYLQEASEPVTAADLSAALGISAREARDTLALLARTDRAIRVARGRYQAAAAPGRDPQGGYGSVSRRAREFLSLEPDRVWTAAELAVEVGISREHATTILAAMVRGGTMTRIERGRYRLIAERADPRPHPSTGWLLVGTVEDALLLRDGDSRLWIAERATRADLRSVA